MGDDLSDMRQSILITGVSGSGKSEVSRQLKSLGHETYDMDSIEDLCVMVDKKTGLPTPYDNGNDLEKIQKMNWLYKKDRLADFIANQKNETAFYCGFPNNLQEILPLFTKIILLTASPDNIRQRLVSRTDNGFGKSVEVQNHILNGKDKLERELQEKGAFTVSTDASVIDVMTAVIRAAS